MSRWQIKFKPIAIRDIRDAGLWYENERAGLSARFLDEIATVEARLLDNPLQFPSIGVGVRRALIRDFPYTVYFTLVDQLIEVEAVLHQHRGPAALRIRLEEDG